MAVNIYRCQITRKPTELNRRLIAAMCNEMTHVQDFQVKLFEHGLSPSPIRWAYWTLGCLLGTVSRLLGARATLRTGIWVETKAVEHYARLLEQVEWDHDTRRIIEKDKADEAGHINCWKQLLDGGPIKT
jgi:ubiquinone biosynthesis monooxygenase Coq7